MLLALTGIRGIANSFFSNTWLSWLRDLLLQEVLGRFFSRRQAAANVATAVIGLGAAFYSISGKDRSLRRMWYLATPLPT